MQTSKQPQSHKFSKGELVRWFERYADGFAIRDAGIGVIVDIKKYSYKSLDGEVYEYANFAVYRNNFNDIITLSEHDLESL